MAPRGADVAAEHPAGTGAGPDSLALLVLASAAGCRATAVHVDHGLRVGSAGEADVVRDAAAAIGAGFRAERVEVPPGPNLEARARAARYAALPDGVLTGHTLDDQAETVLLQLLRGAGATGLAGMRADGRPGAAGGGRSVGRPLLALRRGELAALVAARGLRPVHDPSNDDPAHRRNRVRHELLPLMAEVAGRDVAPLLARQAALLGDEDDLLDDLAAGLDPTDARAVAAAPRPLARRALRRWLRAGGHPPDSAAVARVLAVAAGAVRATEVGGGRRVSRRDGRLRLHDG